MKKINWGIVGLGNIANKFAEGFSKVDNCSLKGISSKDNDNLNLFKKKFNIEDKFCFNNYKDLISSTDIDIVYIALPNSFHAKNIIACIENNKNVLVEKPAVINFQEFKNIKKIIGQNEAYFTEGFMYRYLPYFSKLKEIILSKSLGDVTEIKSNFNSKIYKQKEIFGFKIQKPDYSNRLFNKDLGGGAILDLGCYPLTFSTFINSLTHNVELKDISFEKVKKEYCESGVDIFSSLNLNFNGKFNSNITCSFKDNFNQSTEINFEKGSILIDESWVPNEKMTMHIKNQDNKTVMNFENNENIYSYQIESISNQLLSQKFKPIFPSLTIEEIEINSNLLDRWINYI